MKFAVGVSNTRVKESSNNIGDSIIDLAMRGIYHDMGISDDALVPINVNNLSTYNGEPVIFPLVKGYPHFPRLSEAFSDKVHPIFLSFALFGTLDPADVSYLKKYEPIGCRDAYTLEQMQAYGISAYLNGCITICFPRAKGRVAHSPNKKIFLVDIEPELEPYIPSELLQKSVRETHAIEGDLQTSTLIEAERMLSQYREDAELVITSRLHAAVPCLAMGIPVILAKNIYSSRFTWLDRLMPVYCLKQYGEIDWHPQPVDLEHLKTQVLDLAKARLWNAYYMSMLLPSIHNFYIQRANVPFETALTRTIPVIRSKFEPSAHFSYAVWGITSLAEGVVQYMQSTYPNAKLTHVYDKYRKLTFHGIEAQTPDSIPYQNDDLVITCSLSSSIAKQMSDFLRETNFPTERYIIAEHVV